MSDNNSIRLFTLNCASLAAAVEQSQRGSRFSSDETEVEKAVDRLIAEYIVQFDDDIRASAQKMSEYYRIFYMLENFVRRFVEETMVEFFGDDWWDQVVPEIVRKRAAEMRTKEINEALTPRSARQLDYITFGDLGEIIKSNWKAFAGVFSQSSIVAVEKLIARLNLLRGPIAHCGILSETEVVRLKLTVRDWFQVME